MILSIETSTTVCSVALHDEGKLIGTQVYHLTRSHSSLIPAIVDQVLTNGSVQKEDLKAVAVSGGPGSYTGLRIGVTAAKALAYGLKIPLISIPTLEVLLERVLDAVQGDSYIIPMLDARRMEVYMLIASSDGKILQSGQAVILDRHSLEPLDDKPVWMVGDGAEKCETLFSGKRFVFKSDWFPEARYSGRLSFQKYESRIFEDINSFEPDYLKEFQTKKPKSRLLITKE